MKKIFGVLLIILMVIMARGESWWDLLWVPLGYFISLYITAQVILFPLMGIPMAIKRVSKKRMRRAVFFRILRTPVLWIIGIIIVGFLFGWFFPKPAMYLYDNKGFNFGAWLGTLGILLSPLSKRDRMDFYKDFDRACYKYYLTEYVPELETNSIGDNIE
jgi:amino acid transporter